MMSTKLTSLGLLEKKLFLNVGYGVMFSVHEVVSKILSSDSSYIVDVVMWPKFGDQHFYERSYHNLNFIRIWPKNNFFERCSWFKFSNLVLALGMALKFDTIVAKELTLKAQLF